jgi:hypothetical protein
MNQTTRELVFRLANNFCQCDKDCLKKATDVHHMLPNTIVNKKLFPLFIESIFNLKALNNDCHLTKKIPRITDREAKIYEEWLSLFKDGKL